MSKTSRSLPKKLQCHLIPDSNQISLVNCCSFNPPEEWKIIEKTIKKPAKRFINLTIGEKKSTQSSSREIQSKETRSRQLSHQSSRELFEKVKKDFIQQLKLWKEDEGKLLQTEMPKTSRVHVGVQYHDGERYLELNPENEDGELEFQVNEDRNGENNIGSAKWMEGLNSIEEVGVNFQTSEGLITQNSTLFEGLKQKN